MIKRIDKILSEQTNYSRKEIKKLISKELIYVNNNPVFKADEKYDEDNIEIDIDGEKIEIRKEIYLILNKPKGYVSTTDLEYKSVLELVPDKYKMRNLFPAGRLDKDTTGFMIITDDGLFAHNILSPKKHVKKVYEVTIDKPVTEEMKNKFKTGISLKDCDLKEALLEKTSEYTCNVTIREGRYHQIKRMFGVFNSEVLELNRICIGNMYLPKDLKLGEVRELTKEELLKIQEKDK